MTTTVLAPVVAGHDWNRHALCARPDIPIGLWTSTGLGARATAVHLCRYHCPVLAKCAAEALAVVGTEVAYTDIVVGGYDFGASGRERKDRPEWVGCHLCNRHRPWPPQPDVDRPSPRSTQRHGTEAGYSWHRRHGVPYCEPCREAHRVTSFDSKRRVKVARAGAS